jgi:exodeoxyribonuclease VII large subunit
VWNEAWSGPLGRGVNCVTISFMFSSSSYPERVGAPVLSVSGFLLQVRQKIESSFPLGLIGGEVSNLVRASSGHIYFTLKDERAQVRCAMWRNRAQLLGFQLLDGMHVEIRAQATLYEARGDFQLSVDSIRRAGQGSLYEAFLRLKARLEEEGLFLPEKKQTLPVLPRGIGVVTSLAAAALRDVLAVLARRSPHLPVVLYPCPVQGDGAGEQIAEVIKTAGLRAKHDGVDVLIVCRGGGSIEDLWAFNHEAVVRSIAACPIPVVSGVGHETDTTLVDFVADMRAATPSAAAELISAGWLVQRDKVALRAAEIERGWLRYLRRTGQRLDELQRRLTHPRMRLVRSTERLEGVNRRLVQAMHTDLSRRQARLSSIQSLLAAHAPRLAPLQARLDACEQALTRSFAWRQSHLLQKLEGLAARLQSLSPDAVLARGYAIVRSEAGLIVRDASSVADEAPLSIQLARSQLKVRVTGRK